MLIGRLLANSPVPGPRCGGTIFRRGKLVRVSRRTPARLRAELSAARTHTGLVPLLTSCLVQLTKRLRSSKTSTLEPGTKTVNTF